MTLLPLLLSPLALSSFHTTKWSHAPLPSPPSSSPVREVQIAAQPSGDLVLATIADAGLAQSGRGKFMARHLNVWQFTEAWLALGGVLNYRQPRPLSKLNLALDQWGVPVLVWNENYGDNDIVMFRAYQDGRWTDWYNRFIGDDLPYAARTRAVASWDGEVVLAWGENLRPKGSRLTVRRWKAEGKTWQRGEPFNDQILYSRTPALALDARGQETVAWLQGPVLSSNLWVKRWTGQGWEALGGSVNRQPNTYLASTRLILGPDGRPTVAWLEDASGQDALYASRWDGQKWQPLGGRIGRSSASAPSLVQGPQGPVLAWVEEQAGRGQVYLARWQQDRWEQYGPLNRDPRRDARSPSLTVKPDGQVVLAWREDVSGRYQVQLEQFGR